ncbi:keratin, type I cytoskeletal 19-like [Bombina bombina]|uniref:keratin, type I cytoskeletal 19-like n=1 Tax=Bombina bombina TaxID=8345 RepID=UPI00235A71D0|nr:keratin, type I cytoskeletal 19-like [Bombina bombina]
MSFNSSSYLSQYMNGGLSQTKGNYSSSSIYSGTGGHGGCLSRSKSFSSSGPGSHYEAKDYGESFLSNNKKETMQNLNDRLASYLEKVHFLEEANAELELKIQDWHSKRAPKNNKRDYSVYEKAISELQAQLANGHLTGAKLTLQMENAKLASDDFKRRYDTEKAIRTTLERDLEGLRKVMDDLTIVRTDLEMEIEGMRKQLIYMRKSHEEDMKVAMGQKKNSSVNVEIDAAPSQDLVKIIADMRKEYEAIIEKHRKEAADWYNQQSTTVQQEVSINTEVLQSNRNQIKDLKRTLQTLEIELQAEISRKHGLEGTIAETQDSSADQLEKIQATICRLEAELSKVKSEVGRQGNEYKILLDIKSRLENEIATYRRLLDGDNTRGTLTQSEGYTVKTIVQDVVNGRVVSSRITEIPKKL